MQAAAGGLNARRYTIGEAIFLTEAFNAAVYEIVRSIPYGRVTTYGRIAALSGKPRAARAVGRAMRFCPDSLPWQRVVKADGSIAGGAYAELRRALLENEGVGFLEDGRVKLSEYIWP